MLESKNIIQFRKEYRKLNSEVKKTVKRKKTKTLSKIFAKLKRILKRTIHIQLFTSIKLLERKRAKPVPAIKYTIGVLHIKSKTVLDTWKAHFESHLNKQFPRDENALLEFDQSSTTNESEIPPITDQEVNNAIKQLKI